jgi:hypothetical protein
MTPPRDARGRFVKAPQYLGDDFTEADQDAFVGWVNDLYDHGPRLAASGGACEAHTNNLLGLPGPYEEIFEAWSSAQKLRKPRRRWWWPFGRPTP